MNTPKALLIDLDGVFYDKDECSYRDIAIVGLGKTLKDFAINPDELDHARRILKSKHIPGMFNAVLSVCKKHRIPFDVFAEKMVQNTDYSRVKQNKAMLDLLKQIGALMPTYLVTNNTMPHTKKILQCLNGNQPIGFDQLHITPVTIENTFYAGCFHPKKMGNQLTDLCDIIGQKPRQVLLLDDTPDVCDAAFRQKLQVSFVQTPQDTQLILRSLIHEKSIVKRRIAVRKTRG